VFLAAHGAGVEVDGTCYVLEIANADLTIASHGELVFVPYCDNSCATHHNGYPFAIRVRLVNFLTL